VTVMAAVPGRSASWMRLLVALTAARPDWLAWKSVGSALTGDGDVDSAAPAEAWPTIVGTFVQWAAGEGFGAVIVCPHAPGLLHIVALAPGDELLYELDVNRRKVFLGATLFRPADLLPLALMDPEGYRRLRPGAEGLLKLVQNGMARGGRVRWEGIARKGIRELLVADPDGVRAAAPFFGRAAPAAVRGARAVADGRWDRGAMLALEGWCLARALLEPRSILWRVRFRRRRGRCPVLRTVLRDGRRVPLAGREAWLAQVRRDPAHRVIDPRATGASADAAA
jgi:hypothetical protein